MFLPTDGSSADPVSVVGRQEEAAVLDAALAQTAGGTLRGVVVEGVPGVGKTTLVRRFLARHPRVPRTVVSALPWEAGRPGALVERLAGGDWGAPDPATWGRRLARLWGDSAPGEKGEKDEKDGVGAGARVVVVDDAHAADPASLQAVVTAAAVSRGAAVLVVLVAAVGPEVTPRPAVRDALDRFAGARLRVAPLSPESTRLFAARIAGVDLPMPVARRLCRHTGGVPRHLDEILRDSPPGRWSDWQARLPVPTSVAQAVHAALAECAPPARSLVEAAAVLGDLPKLADAAALGAVGAPIDALDQAAAAGLLAAAQGHGLDVLTFPGRFTRGAVHAGLSPGRRHALHRGAAELASDDTERLRHLVEAAPLPDPTLAAELVELARRKADEGEWAVVAGALIDAGRISPVRAEREDRLIQAIDALAGAGLVAQAIDSLPEVEALPAGSRRDAVLAYLAVQRGRRAEASVYLESAWRMRGTDRGGAAVVCQRHVLASLADWDGDSLVRWAGRALEYAPAGAPAAVETRAIVGLGHAARGDLDAAFTAYRRATEESPSGPQHQRARMGHGWLLLAQDEPEAARRELEFAAANVRGAGSNRITLWALVWLARARFALGDWSGALQIVDQGELLLDATDLDLLRPLVHWTGAQVHALRGEFADAERHVELGQAAEHDYLVMTVPALTARAHVAEARSDYEAVARHLAPLARRRDRGGLDEPGFLAVARPVRERAGGDGPARGGRGVPRAPRGDGAPPRAPLGGGPARVRPRAAARRPRRPGRRDRGVRRGPCSGRGGAAALRQGAHRLRPRPHPAPGGPSP